MDENSRHLIDERFNRVDDRFNSVDDRFRRVDERFDRVDERIDRLAEQTRQEIQALDVRLTRIETRLEQTVTRADLEQAMNGIIKWVVGTMFGAGVVAVTVMTFVLNNAIPKAAPPVSSPAPIIIQLPPIGQRVVPKPSS